MKHYIISVYKYMEGDQILEPVKLEMLSDTYKDSIRYWEVKNKVDHYLHGKFDVGIHETMVEHGAKTLNQSVLIYKVDEKQLAMLLLAYS